MDDWYIIPCRSVYQILSFVFFFFNVIYGIVMCFLRVFGMVIFTIVMLFRMDRDVYMRGLEGWDVGTWTSVRLTVHYTFILSTRVGSVTRVLMVQIQ